MALADGVICRPASSLDGLQDAAVRKTAPRGRYQHNAAYTCFTGGLSLLVAVHAGSALLSMPQQIRCPVLLSCPAQYACQFSSGIMPLCAHGLRKPAAGNMTTEVSILSTE